MGRINEEDILKILTPSAQRCYKSLYTKSGNIESKMNLIEKFNLKIINELPRRNESNQKELLNCIYEFSEYIYSCMEYIAQIIRDICRCAMKEELKDGFNKLLSDLDNFNNGKKQSILYSNIVIRNYIAQPKEWYDIIHDIRTEETHYGSGTILVNEQNNRWLLYQNSLRNGKGNKKDIKISLENIIQIGHAYKIFLDGLDNVIEYINLFNTRND